MTSLIRSFACALALCLAISAHAGPADDAVARVILTFDGDRSLWSRRDHMLSELAQIVTGEPLPDMSAMTPGRNPSISTSALAA